MQDEKNNLEFVQCVNFDIKDSVKNNRARYLLIFDNPNEKVFKPKAFVDFAAAGKHRVLNIFLLKHNNLFHQNKLGRDVELQSTHIVLFKSFCDVMQESTLKAQLGL